MMRLFNCSAQTINMTIVDLPRPAWKVLPPRKWQVALTVVGIVLTALVFALT